MYCHNCGKLIKEGSIFCPSCGTKIDNISDFYGKEDDAAESVSNCPLTEDNGLKVVSSDMHKNNKHSKKPIIIVLIVILLIGGIIGAIKLFSKTTGLLHFVDSDLSYEKYVNSFNMNSDLFVAQNDKYIFYINDSGFVVRMDTNGENRVVIIDSTSVDRIQLYKKQLVFHSSEDFGVYSSDLDGKNLVRLVSTKSFWFSVVEDNIYYIDGYYTYEDEYETFGDYSLYKTDFNGTEPVIVLPYSISSASIQNNNIVYYDYNEGIFYITDINGDNRRILYQKNEDENIHHFKVFDNYLFYTVLEYDNDSISGLYRIDLETKEKNKLISTVPGEFTIWEGKIVYVADGNSSSSKTYICDLDGSNKEVFSDNSIYSPLSMGNTIYYKKSGPMSSISSIDCTSHETFNFEKSLYSNVCFSDYYMFFINKDDECLYRCDFNGGNIVKLTDSMCSAIYTYNNELYYYGYANGHDRDNDTNAAGVFAHGLFKLDCDGGWCNAVELNGNSNNIFYNDYVYFTSSYDSHLYRTSTSEIDDDEENVPYIRAKGDNHFSSLLFVKEDWLYLKMSQNSSWPLVRINLLTEKIETISDDSVWDVTVFNDRLFFNRLDENDKYQLKSANLDGSDEKLVLREEISEFCLQGNRIYYIDSSYGHLYSINIDGTEKQLLVDSCCSGLSIKAEKLYYSDLFNRGILFSIDLDGENKQQILGSELTYTEKTEYTTKGIDDVGAEEKKEKTKRIDYSPDERIEELIEDHQFERFLHEMFDTDAIYGSDLLSVQFFGYYEGAPTQISSLKNHGEYSQLMENCVLFSTESFSSSIEAINVLCGDATGDTLSYRNNCTVVTVRSNEWIAEHVLPYLYFFKNLKWFTYGYCWVGDNLCLPEGTSQTSINGHSRYFHDPYDPFYDDEMEAEYLNDLVGTWRCADTYRTDTFNITTGGKMHVKTEWPQNETQEEYDLTYSGGVFDDEFGYGYECNLNSNGTMTVYWVSNNDSAVFRRIN